METKRQKTLKKSEGPEGLAKPNIVSVGYPLKDFCEQNLKESSRSRVREKRKTIRKNCMVLQRVLTHTSPRGKRYYKFRLVISKPLIRLLEWRPGLLIKEEIVGDSLVLTPVNREASFS